MIAGVDISAFQQGPGVWEKEAGKISFAAVKISELSSAGPYVSPDAAADWAALGKLGKGRIAYLFGHPGMPASATVSLFLGHLNPLGLEDGDGVALDLEVTDGLHAAAVAAWARDVLALLERETSRSPLLYSFISFIDAGNCAGLGAYPLWLADPSSAPGKPRVPAPWKTWAIQQTGISGAIDRDVANFANLAGFRHALGKAVPVASVTDYKTTGRESLLEVAASHKTAPSTILRMTAIRDGKFHADLAAYINLGNLKAPMASGIVLRVPVRP